MIRNESKKIGNLSFCSCTRRARVCDSLQTRMFCYLAENNPRCHCIALRQKERLEAKKKSSFFATVFKKSKQVTCHSVLFEISDV